RLPVHLACRNKEHSPHRYQQGSGTSPEDSVNKYWTFGFCPVPGLLPTFLQTKRTAQKTGTELDGPIQLKELLFLVQSVRILLHWDWWRLLWQRHGSTLCHPLKLPPFSCLRHRFLLQTSY